MTEAAAPQPAAPASAAPATVADVMRPPVTAVTPNDHAAAAAYLMRRSGATALVILDQQNSQPIGLITEADIVQLVADGRDADEVRIHDLMAKRLSIVEAAAGIRDAANTMISGHFRHLPVMSEGGLVGIVDITDITRALLASGA